MTTPKRDKNITEVSVNPMVGAGHPPLVLCGTGAERDICGPTYTKQMIRWKCNNFAEDALMVLGSWLIPWSVSTSNI